MFCEFDQGRYGWFDVPIRTRQTFTGCGYDPLCYIATGKLASSPYVTQDLITAKLGGLIKLIEACDDQQPPSGDFNDQSVQSVYNMVIQAVVTEINGYLSSIYPIPLVQTNTIAVVQVTAVDSTGAVTAISVTYAGNYLTAPATANTPTYLRYIDPLANVQWFGQEWNNCQLGIGLQLTVAYANAPYSDENGTTINCQTITGTPVILAAGTGYQVDDLLVLTGGTSVVPAKIRESAQDLICHTFYKRRLAPDEKNPFSTLAKMWRDMLIKIGDGELELDGTFKRSFSIGAMWGTRSVMNASSL